MSNDQDMEVDPQAQETPRDDEVASDDEAFIDVEGVEGGVVRATEGEDGDDTPVTLKDDSYQAFFSHNDSVYSVALQPGGTLGLSGGGDDVGYLFNTTDGEEVFKLEGHTDSVAAVAFSNDGKLAGTAGLDGTVKIWDVTNGQCTATLEGPDKGLDWMQFHPKGPVVLAGGEDGMAWLWNANGTLLMCFSGHSDHVTCGSFTSDGKLVCTGGGENDKSVRIWNPKTGEATFVVQGHGFHEEGLNVLRSHPNAEQPIIATGGMDARAILTNTQNGRVVGALNGAHEDSVEDVAFCPTQPFLATAGLDKKMVIWDLNSGTARSTCTHESGVIKTVWHPTEPLVYTASIDSKVRLWDGRSGAVVKVWEGHRDGVLDMVMAQDGSFVMTSSDDKTVLLFKQ